jgi:hypothetical protein
MFVSEIHDVVSDGIVVVIGEATWVRVTDEDSDGRNGETFFICTEGLADFWRETCGHQKGFFCDVGDCTHLR